jgi:phage shock protein C
MTKRLYRSRKSKVLEGVCGGVGEYFDVDPVLIRLIYLMATVFTGFVPGIIGYIIAMFVVPEMPKITESTPATAET